MKRVAKHVDDVEMKAHHMAEMKAKFDEHNLLQKEKNELKHEHLDFLRRLARKVLRPEIWKCYKR